MIDKTNYSSDVTFLINSCDKFDDVWPIYFKALKAQFPESTNFPFVLNTESKTFSFENFDINCYQFYKGNEKLDSWSMRLYKTLDAINTEFIVFSLEDYFIEERVDFNKFLKAIDFIKTDPDIDMISFMTYGNDNRHYYIDDNKCDFLVLYPKIARWKITCKIALWRRKSLMYFLNLYESPWEFEIMGTWRACKSNKKFYTVKPGYKVIEYKPYSLGIHQNKWKNSNISKEYFSQNGIFVDFAKRGFIEMDDEYSIINTLPSGIFKKVFWKNVFLKFKNNRFSLSLVKIYIYSVIIKFLEKVYVFFNKNKVNIISN